MANVEALRGRAPAPPLKHEDVDVSNHLLLEVRSEDVSCIITLARSYVVHLIGPQERQDGTLSRPEAAFDVKLSLSPVNASQSPASWTGG